jgi:hypothetical protein
MKHRYTPPIDTLPVAGPKAAFTAADAAAAAQAAPITVIKPKKPKKLQRSLHWIEACMVRADQ